MRISLRGIDYAILFAYFSFVVAVGWIVRRRVHTSEDFLTSHRSVPVWITSLAFIAANLGAQEVMGMCASGAKYGMMTFHFYWIGAIPAMMSVFSSGISLYALGTLFQLLLGWTFTQSVLLSAAVVLVYTLLGGLTSAIYNEVLQFFLIVIGFSP